MYATARTSFVRPDKIDDAVLQYQAWAASDAQPAEGYRGLIGMVDEATGKGVGISLYDTLADIDAGGARIEQALARFRSIFAVPPMLELFEVFIDAIPDGVDADCARVTTIRVRPDAVEEVFALIRENVVCTVERQRGYQGFLGLGDRATGKTVHLTLWRGDDDLEASERSGNYQNQLARVFDRLSEPPIREVFQVSALKLVEGR